MQGTKRCTIFKILLIIFILLTGLTLADVFVEGPCSVPEDLPEVGGYNIVTISVKFCPGTYSEQIRIVSDDVFVYCEDTQFLGSGFGTGFTVYDNVNGYGFTNVTIRNCTINNYNTAIFVNDTNNSKFEYNTFINSYKGLSLESSNLNSIRFNNISANNDFGVLLSNSHYNWLINNSVDFNDMGEGGDGILIQNANHNVLINNTANYNFYSGVTIQESLNTTLQFNYALGNFHGFYLLHSNFSTFNTNWAHSNTAGSSLPSGYYLLHSYNNTLTNSHAYFNKRGITIDGASMYNNISQATLTNNTLDGVYIKADDNYISYSTASFNENNGFYVDGGYGNEFDFNFAFNSTAGFKIDNNCGYNYLTNNTAYNNDKGFHIEDVFLSEFFYNNAYSNDDGFYFRSCDENIVQSNIATSNNYGFWASIFESDSLYKYNYATLNTYGYLLSDNIDDNDFIENYAIANDYGFKLVSGEVASISPSDNTFSKNIINLNSEVGFDAINSNNNTLYNNTMAFNKIGLRMYGTEDEYVELNNIYSNTEDGIHLRSGVATSEFTSNFVCNNTRIDINETTGDHDNTGDDNSCDTASNWNDDGYTNCTNYCTVRNMTIAIDNGAGTTSSRYVDLYLFALNAMSCRYQNDDDDWTSWTSYTPYYENWDIINETEGEYQVNYQCQNSIGMFSSVVSDTINYTEGGGEFTIEIGGGGCDDLICCLALDMPGCESDVNCAWYPVTEVCLYNETCADESCCNSQANATDCAYTKTCYWSLIDETCHHNRTPPPVNTTCANETCCNDIPNATSCAENVCYWSEVDEMCHFVTTPPPVAPCSDESCCNLIGNAVDCALDNCYWSLIDTTCHYITTPPPENTTCGDESCCNNIANEVDCALNVCYWSLNDFICHYITTPETEVPDVPNLNNNNKRPYIPVPGDLLPRESSVSITCEPAYLELNAYTKLSFKCDVKPQNLIVDNVNLKFEAIHPNIKLGDTPESIDFLALLEEHPDLDEELVYSQASKNLTVEVENTGCIQAMSSIIITANYLVQGYFSVGLKPEPEEKRVTYVIPIQLKEGCQNDTEVINETEPPVVPENETEGIVEAPNITMTPTPIPEPTLQTETVNTTQHQEKETQNETQEKEVNKTEKLPEEVTPTPEPTKAPEPTQEPTMTPTQKPPKKQLKVTEHPRKKEVDDLLKEINELGSLFKKKVDKKDYTIKMDGKEDLFIAVSGDKTLKDAKKQIQDLQNVLKQIKTTLKPGETDEELQIVQKKIKQLADTTPVDVVVKKEVEQKTVQLTEKEIEKNVEESLVLGAQLTKTRREEIKRESKRLIPNMKTKQTIKQVEVEFISGKKEIRTLVTQTFTNTNTESVEHVSVVLIIPKEVAETVADLMFAVPPTVLKDDPIVAWHQSKLEPGQEVNVSFTTKNPVDPALLKKVRPIVIPDIKLEPIDVSVADSYVGLQMFFLLLTMAMISLGYAVYRFSEKL